MRRILAVLVLVAIQAIAASAVVAAPVDDTLGQSPPVVLYGDGDIDCPDPWAHDVSTPVGTVKYTPVEGGIHFRIVLDNAAPNWNYEPNIGQPLGDCIDWDKSQWFSDFSTDQNGDAVFEATYLADPGTYSVIVNIRSVSGTTPNANHQQIGPSEFTEVAALPPQPIGNHTVGFVDPTQGLWHLRSHDGSVDTFRYGNPGDYPFLGDWDCNGVETPGLYRQSDGRVYLRNSNTWGSADITFFFGNPGDVPIAGDFNGDGCDTVSIYRPSNSRFYIINELGSNDGGLGTADIVYTFGNPGDKPFVGDWNGDGVETAGLHRESTGLMYIRNIHRWGPADEQFIFGNPGDRVVAGDWNWSGTYSPAVFRPSDTTVYYRYTNTQGAADSWFIFGEPDWIPVAGDSGR